MLLTINSSTLQDVLKCATQLRATHPTIDQSGMEGSENLRVPNNEEIQTTSLMPVSEEVSKERIDQVPVPDDSLSPSQHAQHWRHEFSFEQDLRSSRIYKRIGFTASISSLETKCDHTMTWSVLSNLSVADVSNISVISLAVTLDQISNKSYYDGFPRQPASDAVIISQTAADLIDGEHEKFEKGAGTDRFHEGIVTHFRVTNHKDQLQLQLLNDECDTTLGMKAPHDSSYAGTLVRCFPYGQEGLRRARILGLVLTLSEAFSNHHCKLRLYLLFRIQIFGFSDQTLTSATASIMLNNIYAGLFKTKNSPSLATRLLVDRIQSYDIEVHQQSGEVTLLVLGRFVDLSSQEQLQFAQRSMTMAKGRYYRIGSGEIQPWGQSKIYGSAFCGTASEAGRRYIVDMTGGIHSLEVTFQLSDMHSSGLNLTKLILEKLRKPDESG